MDQKLKDKKRREQLKMDALRKMKMKGVPVGMPQGVPPMGGMASDMNSMMNQ